MRSTVRTVTTATEYHAVCRLRYEVYVRERGIDEKHADHGRGVIEEPMDRQGTILAGLDGDRVVGSIRMNTGDDRHAADYAEFYEIDRVGDVNRSAKAIVTKLMVAPPHRGSPVAVRLVQEAYRRLLEMGARYAFIDANENLFRFYERLGFIPHLEDTHHPAYGFVRRYVLDLHDEARLESVRSPLLALLRAWRASAQLVDLRASA